MKNLAPFRKDFSAVLGLCAFWSPPFPQIFVQVPGRLAPLTIANLSLHRPARRSCGKGQPNDPLPVLRLISVMVPTRRFWQCSSRPRCRLSRWRGHMCKDRPLADVSMFDDRSTLTSVPVPTVTVPLAVADTFASSQSSLRPVGGGDQRAIADRRNAG